MLPSLAGQPLHAVQTIRGGTDHINQAATSENMGSLPKFGISVNADGPSWKVPTAYPYERCP
jgi:hypothetical protein